MEDKEIIKAFFASGCIDVDGKRIPLRNCDKINHLYRRDLKKSDCCMASERDITLLYHQRLEEFLRIEKLRGLNT